MKLVSCTPYVVETPPSHYARGGAFLTFVKLETDNGIVGWGEATAQDALQYNWKCYPPLMLGLFEKFLKGEDALEREKLLKRMYARYTAFSCDFVNASYLSAFDLALWDIAGKAMGQPVYQLLGGKYRDKLRTYTYIFTQPDTLDTIEGWRNPEALVKHAKKYVDMGYTALKFDPLKCTPPSGYPATPWELSTSELHFAEDTIVKLRNAVGSEIELLMGTHGQLTTASAIRFGKMLEKHDILWFEEPVSPDNEKEMAKVARAVHVPVSTGERLAFSYAFQRVFDAEACAIAQPDLGSCGGITEAKKIASMAEPKYIQMAPHHWGGPITLAGAMQLDTCISNFMIQECINEGSGGFFGELVDEPFVWKDGYFDTLERPGLGINLKEEALIKYMAK